MNLVSCESISFVAASGPLFSDASFGIAEGDRIALIGRNGSGKTSLMRIVAGLLKPDSGRVAAKRGLRVSFLPQSPSYEPGESLGSFLASGDGPAHALVREYEAALSSNLTGPARESLERRMEEEGGWLLERRLASMARELGLPGLEAPMDSFSGGMVRKAALARCLAPEADLILLDEPTNHLDVETVEWLETRIKTGGFACCVVTHDRYFMDEVCDRVLEIDRARVHAYEGGYSDFLERKRERWEALERADERREAVLKIEMKWLMRGARARAGKSERRKELIRAMESSALERPKAMATLSAGSARLGRKVLAFRGVEKSFGGRRVIGPFDYEFTTGERIGVVGPNGSGKSTLLKLATGELAPDAGLAERGATLVVERFSQDMPDRSRDLTALEYIRERAETIKGGSGEEWDAERFLERFLFPRHRHGQKLASLSGGEARRLQLLRVLAGAPNFLALDEPTNDFDLETIELLEDFLEGFPGCLLVVSHDRAFLDRTTDKSFYLDGSGAIRVLPASFGEWREAELEREAAGRLAGTGRATKESAPRRERPRDEGKRRPSHAERKEWEAILPEIEALEAEKAALEALFASGASAPELARAHGRYEELCPLIEARVARWEELASLMEGA